MKPRPLPAAMVALVTSLLLAVTATAHADDPGDPTTPTGPTTTTAIPHVDGGPSRTAGPVTVGIQTATADGPDDRANFTYEIEPKGVEQDYVAVYNYSLRPVDVTLAARDATTTPGSPFAVQSNRARATDVGSWIAIAQPRLHLAPRTRTLVPFQVGVPYDVTPGDHAGAIVLTVLTAKHGADSGQQVVVEDRVGLRVYVRVPGALRARLRVNGLRASFDGGWSSLGVGHSTIDYTVRNVGNLTLSGHQVVDLLRSSGLAPIGLHPEGIDGLLPGGHIAVHEISGRFFAIGPLETRVTVTPTSTDTSTDKGLHLDPVTASVHETVLPYGLLILLILLLVLAGLLTRWVRRWRRRRPPKVKDPAHRRVGPTPTPAEQAATGEEPTPVGAGSSVGPATGAEADR